MNSIKTKISLFLCSSFLCFSSPFYVNVHASGINTNSSIVSTSLLSESNVSINKPLVITFTAPITLDSLDGVFVEKKFQNVPVLVSVLDNKTLAIRPINSYEENTSYTATIILKDNKKYSLNFVTETLPSNDVSKIFTDTSVYYNITHNNTPSVDEVKIIDAETLRIKFDKSVRTEFAKNPLNYQLRDKNYSTVNNHIKTIQQVYNSNAYDIVFYKTAGDAKANGIVTNNPDSEIWNLDENQYSITIGNIPSASGVVMYAHTFVTGTNNKSFFSALSSQIQTQNTVKMSSDEINQLPSQNNVSINKPWTITFNKPITWNNIDGISVQKGSTFAPIEVNKITNTTLSITPTIFYDANSKYNLKVFLNDGSKYSLDFTTEDVPATTNSSPRVLSVKSTDTGTIYVKFDKVMDKKTAFITSNWELNGYKLCNLGFKESDFDISADGSTIELKNLNRYIDVGSNILYIHSNITDTYGNSVKPNTRATFEYLIAGTAQP